MLPMVRDASELLLCQSIILIPDLTRIILHSLFAFYSI